MKIYIDKYVFSIALFLGIMELITFSYIDVVRSSTILYLIMVKYRVSIFAMLIGTRAKKDSDYNFVYQLLGIMLAFASELVIFRLIDNYYAGTSSHAKIIIEGMIRALIWGYFYQIFKRYSVKKKFG